MADVNFNLTTRASTLVFGPQNANFVLAGPTSGSPASSTFRALVSADIPTLPYLTSANVDGGSANSNYVVSQIIDGGSA